MPSVLDFVPGDVSCCYSSFAPVTGGLNKEVIGENQAKSD
jgi:hypothetical protein